jgi:hypothetical protein
MELTEVFWNFQLTFINFVFLAGTIAKFQTSFLNLCRKIRSSMKLRILLTGTLVTPQPPRLGTGTQGGQMPVTFAPAARHALVPMQVTVFVTSGLAEAVKVSSVPGTLIVVSAGLSTAGDQPALPLPQQADSAQLLPDARAALRRAVIPLGPGSNSPAWPRPLETFMTIPRYSVLYLT